MICPICHEHIYQCERCGGAGWQQAGRYWNGQEYVFCYAGTCEACCGFGVCPHEHTVGDSLWVDPSEKCAMKKPKPSLKELNARIDWRKVEEYARNNPPPQEWFDEDFSQMYAETIGPEILARNLREVEAR